LNDLSQNLEHASRQCGPYHGLGHIKIAECCLDEKHLLANRKAGKEGRDKKHGIMKKSKGSARHPVFYRWHLEIDNKYKMYLDTLPLYIIDDLLPPLGITVKDITVYSLCPDVQNVVETFWKFSSSVHSNTTYQLDHERFEFKIKLQNSVQSRRKLIIRIFLGLEEFLNETKWYVELDRFAHTPNGQIQETIVRQDLQAASAWKSQDGKYDRCGWPQNLLLPKGYLHQFTNMRVLVFVNDLPNQRVNEGEKPTEPTILCGANFAKNIFHVADPRDSGFPLNREWFGVDKVKVLNNLDSAFGIVSSPLRIYHRGTNETMCAGTSSKLKSTTTTTSTTVTTAISTKENKNRSKQRKRLKQQKSTKRRGTATPATTTTTGTENKNEEKTMTTETGTTTTTTSETTTTTNSVITTIA